MQQKWQRVIPGYYFSLTLTLLGLGLIVVLPLTALLISGWQVGAPRFWHEATQQRVLASYLISIKGAAIAASVNTIFGLLLAWVLTQYTFPGKWLLDSLLDLPFALPTAVAGIALAYLFSDRGWLGRLVAPLGWQVSYTFNGIVVAMIFVTLPFVVREVQPVLAKLDPSVQEAAHTLGGSTFTILRLVVLPEILPALVAGFGLVFTRCLGEYGSIVFIAGNQPYRTEITPLLIMFKLEEHSYQGATVLALVMLVFSFIFNFIIHNWQRHLLRRKG
ncbi:sulfate ABC transporter permease subunit CysT [Loigolactobacillus binensis]|uniref:Sulfate transport system permease protein CysT n=1 Tax=Loigolactobacillus binensis TaxID=2559922 RepID=A0ABW3EA86_9LACO|nr:sulfate ABC transporter permease subunit CysT [Loigolactobacillus binensis]